MEYVREKMLAKLLEVVTPLAVAEPHRKPIAHLRQIAATDKLSG